MHNLTLAHPETSPLEDINHSQQELDGSYRNSHQVHENAHLSRQPRQQYQSLIQVGGRGSFECPIIHDENAYAQLHESKKLICLLIFSVINSLLYTSAVTVAFTYSIIVTRL